MEAQREIGFGCTVLVVRTVAFIVAAFALVTTNGAHRFDPALCGMLGGCTFAARSTSSPVAARGATNDRSLVMSLSCMNESTLPPCF